MTPRHQCIIGALCVSAIAGLATSRAMAMPDQIRIPIVKKHPKGAPQAQGRFSHSSHNNFGCYACHPATFPYEAKGFTHEEMDSGLYCGSCHNGRNTWAVRGADCQLCHVDAHADAKKK